MRLIFKQWDHSARGCNLVTRTETFPRLLFISSKTTNWSARAYASSAIALSMIASPSMFSFQLSLIISLQSLNPPIWPNANQLKLPTPYLFWPISQKIIHCARCHPGTPLGQQPGITASVCCLFHQRRPTGVQELMHHQRLPKA